MNADGRPMTAKATDEGYREKRRRAVTDGEEATGVLRSSVGRRQSICYAK
jgi:hypothetical protein